MTALMEGLTGGPGGMWIAIGADVLVKAALLILSAGLVTKLLMRAPASLRHQVWAATFAGVLALPLLSVTMPSWSVVVPGLGQREATIQAEEVTPPASGVDRTIQDPAVGAAATVEGPERAGGPSGAQGANTGIRSPALADILVVVWLLGVSVLLGRLGLGYLLARRMSNRGDVVVDGAWRAIVSDARSELGIRAPVRVVSSPDVGSPMTWGLLRPVLLLPEGSEAWTEERRRAVALHELAHVGRRDCFVHLMSGVALALHWINPLMWVAAARIRRERERACDDVVLTAGANGPDYAAVLLDVARARGRRGAAWAAVSMAQPSELEGRVLAILDPARNRARVGRRASAAALAGVVAIAVPLAALQATPSPPPDAQVSATTGAGETPVALAAPFPATEDAALPPVSEGPGAIPSDQDLTTTTDTTEIVYIEAIAGALQDESERVRVEAAQALGSIESPLAVPFLSAATDDESADVRRRVAWALGMIESPDAVTAVVPLLQDEDAEVREEAAWALGMIESPDAVTPLLPLLGDSVEDVREQAVWALGMIEDGAAVEALIGVLTNDGAAAVREDAAWALGMIEDDRAAEALADAIADEDEEVARQAMWALARVMD